MVVAAVAGAVVAAAAVVVVVVVVVVGVVVLGRLAAQPPAVKQKFLGTTRGVRGVTRTALWVTKPISGDQRERPPEQELTSEISKA